MKNALQELLTLLIALVRIPADEEDAIAAQKQKIEDHKALINTAHGDSELNDPTIIELIDDLTEVAATATPDPEYAEVPEEVEAEQEGETEGEGEAEEATNDGSEEEGEKEEKEEKEEPKHETALQKKRRLAAEKEDATTKKSKRQ